MLKACLKYYTSSKELSLAIKMKLSLTIFIAAVLTLYVVEGRHPKTKNKSSHDMEDSIKKSMDLQLHDESDTTNLETKDTDKAKAEKSDTNDPAPKPNPKTKKKKKNKPSVPHKKKTKPELASPPSGSGEENTTPEPSGPTSEPVGEETTIEPPGPPKEPSQKESTTEPPDEEESTLESTIPTNEPVQNTTTTETTTPVTDSDGYPIIPQADIDRFKTQFVEKGKMLESEIFEKIKYLANLSIAMNDESTTEEMEIEIEQNKSDVNKELIKLMAKLDKSNYTIFVIDSEETLKQSFEQLEKEKKAKNDALKKEGISDEEISKLKQEIKIINNSLSEVQLELNDNYNIFIRMKDLEMEKKKKEKADKNEIHWLTFHIIDEVLIKAEYMHLNEVNKTEGKMAQMHRDLAGKADMLMYYFRMMDELEDAIRDLEEATDENEKEKIKQKVEKMEESINKNATIVKLKKIYEKEISKGVTKELLKNIIQTDLNRFKYQFIEMVTELETEIRDKITYLANITIPIKNETTMKEMAIGIEQNESAVIEELTKFMAKLDATNFAIFVIDYHKTLKESIEKLENEKKAKKDLLNKEGITEEEMSNLNQEIENIDDELKKKESEMEDYINIYSDMKDFEKKKKQNAEEGKIQLLTREIMDKLLNKTMSIHNNEADKAARNSDDKMVTLHQDLSNKAFKLFKYFQKINQLEDAVKKLNEAEDENEKEQYKKKVKDIMESINQNEKIVELKKNYQKEISNAMAKELLKNIILTGLDRFKPQFLEMCTKLGTEIHVGIIYLVNITIAIKDEMEPNRTAAIEYLTKYMAKQDATNFTIFVIDYHKTLKESIEKLENEKKVKKDLLNKEGITDEVIAKLNQEIENIDDVLKKKESEMEDYIYIYSDMKDMEKKKKQNAEEDDIQLLTCKIMEKVLNKTMSIHNYEANEAAKKSDTKLFTMHQDLSNEAFKLLTYFGKVYQLEDAIKKLEEAKDQNTTEQYQKEVNDTKESIENDLEIFDLKKTYERKISKAVIEELYKNLDIDRLKTKFEELGTELETEMMKKILDLANLTIAMNDNTTSKAIKVKMEKNISLANIKLMNFMAKLDTKNFAIFVIDYPKTMKEDIKQLENVQKAKILALKKSNWQEEIYGLKMEINRIGYFLSEKDSLLEEYSYMFSEMLDLEKKQLLIRGSIRFKLLNEAWENHMEERKKARGKEKEYELHDALASKGHMIQSFFIHYNGLESEIYRLERARYRNETDMETYEKDVEKRIESINEIELMKDYQKNITKVVKLAKQLLKSYDSKVAILEAEKNVKIKEWEDKYNDAQTALDAAKDERQEWEDKYNTAKDERQDWEDKYNNFYNDLKGIGNGGKADDKTIEKLDDVNNKLGKIDAKLKDSQLNDEERAKYENEKNKLKAEKRLLLEIINNSSTRPFPLTEWIFSLWFLWYCIV